MTLASLRGRLTLWYVGTMVAVLTVYAAGVFVLLMRSLGEARDHHLEEDLAVAADLIHAAPDESVHWRVESVTDTGYDAGERRWIEVWTPDGRRLFHRVAEADQALQAVLAPPGAPGFSTVRVPDGPRLRLLVEARATEIGPLLFRVARRDTTLIDEVLPILLRLLVAIPLAVGLAGIGGYLMARRALAPVERMAARAAAISAERLHERLPVENPDDELGRLATAVNQTLVRLERSFDLLRQFTADASHELRTPLTALRSVGEVGLREPRTAEAYREIIGSMLEETDRLGRLVGSLLSISRADAGQVRLVREPVELGSLARDVAAHLAVLAEDREQRIQVDADGSVVVKADRLVLRQALVNLVDNAIKHGPERAQVRVVVSRRDGTGIVEVIDQGPGIAPQYRERVFDRFFRIDQARARAGGGAGLGLAIARWAVAAQGGYLELDSEVGRGSCFRILLPAGTS